MRLSRRSNTIILWVISIGLMVGMIITFTPTLGNFFGGSQGGAQDGGTALLVNGQPISQLDVSQLQQQNHALSAIQEGEMRQDIELLILDSLVRNEVLRQAASSMRVSGGDFRTAFNNFRESQGVAGARNDDAYLRLVNNLGYTDQTFRDALRAQLRLQSYQGRHHRGRNGERRRDRSLLHSQPGQLPFRRARERPHDRGRRRDLGRRPARARAGRRSLRRPGHRQLARTGRSRRRCGRSGRQQ